MARVHRPAKAIAQSHDMSADQIVVIGTVEIHRTPCGTTTHWATHIAAPCAPYGTGQCDGHCYAHGKECTCSCHSGWDEIGQTVAEVKVWHDEHNGLKGVTP